ncbi:MAG TPA: pyridoxal-phosphate dependent enzyme [Chitinophagaceae bacterium]|nr:pyridoxal-phosphate dependent enzyme [Chitinophagaceae bacterium]
MCRDPELPDFSRIRIDRLAVPELTGKKISLDVLRLDLLHPLLSGNKWFKLRYWIQEARLLGKEILLSFGGAYSNHLVALAVAGKIEGLQTVGVVRGERTGPLPSTLSRAENYGMILRFVSRTGFSQSLEEPHQWLRDYPDAFIIPQGGWGPPGARGAAGILDPQSWPGLPGMAMDFGGYSHIAVAAGTGTTAAGLLNGSEPDQTIVAFPVMKHENRLLDPIRTLVPDPMKFGRLRLFSGYAFGGFAVRSPDLLAFMNWFHSEYRIPTDFVYTGKLFFGLLNQIRRGSFPPGSRILAIHTGGLQGNHSLPPGSLTF